MKVLELFAGTKSISKAFKKAGHEVYTIDNNPDLNPDLCINILDLTPDHIPFKPDVIWASPPCTCFSVASISKHWQDQQPKTINAALSIHIVKRTLELINKLKPKYWFLENPRGMLRTLPLMRPYIRKTATYCQYGDFRQKPTDIWTNCEEWTPKKCDTNSTCHEASPRGSTTGTQGMANATERGAIPYKLCNEIVRICENNYKTFNQVTLNGVYRA